MILELINDINKLSFIEFSLFQNPFHLRIHLLDYKQIDLYWVHILI